MSLFWRVMMVVWSFVIAPLIPSAGESLIMPRASESLLLDAVLAGQRILVVGERGHILFSDHAGVNWIQAEVPTRQMLTAIHFPTPQHGWAVGHDGLILASVDGGAHWTLQRDGLLDQQSINRGRLRTARRRLQQAQQRMLEAASASERKQLLVTLAELEQDLEDAEEVLREAVHAPPLLDVFFLDELRGFAVGAFNTLLHTTDGGVSWQLESHRLENPDAYHLNAITGHPGGKLWIATEGGLFLHSADAGDNWQSLPTPYRGSWFGIIYQPETNILLAFGLRGNVYRSSDAGASWRKVTVDTTRSLAGGQFVSEQYVLLVGAAGTLMVSADGGHSFRQQNLEQRANLSAVVVAGDRAVLVGQHGVFTGLPYRLVDD